VAVVRQYRVRQMRQNIVDVGAPAGSFYRPCATRSRSRRSSPRCPHVETSSSRWWRCHQLAVLGRSNRRVRPSDRLFWVCVRRWWPRWKDGLVLVHPATVARWRREGFRWLGHRARRRPGRPRIEPQLRSLIQRMAMENGLWGAPRIHGELLKLGFIVSERTVSRYLPDRRTRRSQTWRTFFANHIGNLACTSTITSSFAPSHVDVDASVLPCRPGPPLCGRYASTPWAVVDWPASHQPTSLGHCFAEPQLRRRTRTRFTSGTDPPRSRAIKTCAGRSPRTTSFAEGTSVRFKRGPYGDPALTSARVGSFGV